MIYLTKKEIGRILPEKNGCPVWKGFRNCFNMVSRCFFFFHCFGHSYETQRSFTRRNAVWIILKSFKKEHNFKFVSQMDFNQFWILSIYNWKEKIKKSDKCWAVNGRIFLRVVPWKYQTSRKLNSHTVVINFVKDCLTIANEKRGNQQLLFIIPGTLLDFSIQFSEEKLQNSE